MNIIKFTVIKFSFSLKQYPFTTAVSKFNDSIKLTLFVEPQQIMKSVNVNEFMAKCPSKAEVRQLLSLHYSKYVPHHSKMNSFFMRDLLKGKKLVSTIVVIIFQAHDRNLLKEIDVPYYKGLSIEDLFAFAKVKKDVLKYLPVEEDWDLLPRKWIGK